MFKEKIIALILQKVLFTKIAKIILTEFNQIKIPIAEFKPDAFLIEEICGFLLLAGILTTHFIL
jgi:hypothetical protein